MSIYDFSNIYELGQKQAQDNSPLNRFAQGFQIGAVMRQQQALAAEKESKAEEIRKQAEQAGLIQTQLNEIAAIQDPAEKVNRLTNLGIQYPSLVENVNKISQNINEQAKTIGKDTYLPILYAIKNKNYDVAKKMALQGAEAFKNSGNNRGYETLQGVVNRIDNNENLDTLFVDGSMLVSSILGWDTTMQAMKAGEETAQQGLKTAQEQSVTTIKSEEAKRAPLETQIKQQEAIRAPLETEIKATQAKFEETKQAQELEQRGWNITKLKNDIDISKQNAKIAMMNAALSKENNALKKQELELKLQENIAKRDEVLQTKARDAESKAYVIKDGLDLIKSLKSDKDALTDALGASAFLGSVPGSKARTVSSRIEQLVNVLASENLDKLKGAMSDKDIAFLKAGATTLADRYQDEEAAIKEIDKIQNIFNRNAKNISERFGIPMSFFAEEKMPEGVTVSGSSQIQKLPDGVTIKRVK